MKLSIITINYNNREGLRKTIESVVGQTWQDFEWIIVDGGSTDGSKELIEQTAAQLESQGWTTEQFSGPEDPAAYIAHHPLSTQLDTPHNSHLNHHSLKWCSENDKGVYNAMNKGIAHACGDYMNFMNSGDTFESFITLQQVFANNLHGDVIYGEWFRIYPDHEELKQPPQFLSLWDLFFENICHQAMFIRGRLLREKGYDESYQVLADWKRWRDMILENRSFQYIPVIVCRFEALTGISEKNSFQHRIDSDRLAEDNSLPPLLRKTLTDYSNNMKKFRFYEDCPLTHDTYELVRERRLYQWLIHGTLEFFKVLKKILDAFHL